MSWRLQYFQSIKNERTREREREMEEEEEKGGREDIRNVGPKVEEERPRL